MRIFQVGERFQELAELPAQLPASGYVWIGVVRRDFEAQVGLVQSRLHLRPA